MLLQPEMAYQWSSKWSSSISPPFRPWRGVGGDCVSVCLLQVRKKVQQICGESGPGGGGGGWALLSPRRAVVSAAEAPLVAVLTGVLYGFSTIGAGDTFVAGMLYGLHADAWSREAFAFAVGLATKKVQREGFAGLVP